MVDDENRGNTEDELRRRAEESFNIRVTRYRRGDYSKEWNSFENTIHQRVSGSERDHNNNSSE